MQGRAAIQSFTWVVWALTAVGVALSSYAGYQSWTNEAASQRAAYLAAADNRLLAVEHGTRELLTNLQGIAFALEGHDDTRVDALAQAFVPAKFQHGQIGVIDLDGHELLRHCLTNCPETDAFLASAAVQAGVAEARSTGGIRATSPLPAIRRNWKFTTWLAIAVPLKTRTLVAIIDAEELVETSLAYLRPGGVDVYLFDQTHSSELAYFHRSRKSKTPPNGDPRHIQWGPDHHFGTFEAAGRNWAVHNEPVDSIQSQVGWTPWLTLAVGLILTFAVSRALRVQIRLRREVEREVELRTRSLNQANTHLQEEIEQHNRTQAELASARDAALESARLKSAFLANVSHEIRTPLNGIAGFASILQDSDLDDEQREQAGIIVRCATDLATLINDILDMSRIESGKVELYPTKCRLDQLLRDCHASVRTQAIAKGLTFDLETAPNLPSYIEVDEVRLKQVLRNLLTNAIKFTDHGSVRLRCCLDETTPLRPVQFEVQDTGRGIPTEARSRLFRRFSQVDGSFQRLHGGLGLGLAITLELVERMGGRVHMESELGSGSTFTVQIPLAPHLAEVQTELITV